MFDRLRTPKIFMALIVLTMGVAPSVSAQTAESGGLTAAELEPIKKTNAHLKALFDTITCRKTPQALEVDDYQTYCTELKTQLDANRSNYLDPARKFLETHRAADYPKTVVYPFSGADLMTTVAVFPKSTRFINLTLDVGGPVDALSRLSTKTRSRALLKLSADALKWLLVTGYSSTSSLRRTVYHSLPGLLASNLVGLAAIGGEPVYLRYLKIKRDGTAEYYTDEILNYESTRYRSKGHKKFRSFELGFRLPGSQTVRVFQYLYSNLEDKWLKSSVGKGTRRFLENSGGFATLAKAGEMNLWHDDFSVMRNMIVKQSQYMVSDQSGLTESLLKKTNWAIKPYGTFKCPQLSQMIHKKRPELKPHLYDLIKTFRRSSIADIGFRFGYADCRGRSSMMITTRNQ